ncbi:hypothetical protein GNZ12_33520 [Paraburkholderia sp. 1N]|uniref:Mor transcription activator domain-containing protein n=1 Tax=Paraburkholderia solitsugae TaxID=2675748 RepID=A0ABX2BZ95_9BURK|nr:hypothetical protein [Paraburkholderia solitsugae]NPT46157.1 hypothetical protein [Paraburkholderia solitsugae]
MSNKPDKDPRAAAADEKYIFEHLSKQSPIEIIFKFLESFSPSTSANGGAAMVQSAKVERYVLEALATQLQLFAYAGVTLDEAFGGKTGRQLQQKRTNEKAYAVAFEIACARAGGVTFEKAVDEVAKKLNMSPDTVRDLYKRSGSSAPRKRGGNFPENTP